MKKYSYLACCILAATLYSTISYAKTDNNCIDEKEECEKPIMTLETLVISGTRTEVKSAKYAGSIGVIEENEISISANIVDGLSTIPGVETGGDSGRNIGSQYTIRGFGYQSENRVIIKQDGVPQSPSLFSNHISSFRTDTDILNRVEVVKGASSILYGSGAIGGIINMETKDAKDFLKYEEQFGGLFGARYESNSMHSFRGAIYGQGKDIPIDFVLYGKTAQYNDIDLADGGTEDYQTIDNDEKINTSYINIGFDITDEQRITFSLFDFDESLTTVWQTLYHAEIDEESPIVGSLEQTDYVFDYAFKSNSNTLLDLSAKAYSSKSHYDRGWDDIDEDSGERDTLSYNNKDSRWGLNIKNIANFNLLSINHNLLLGLDYNNREEDAIYLRNGIYTDFGSMPNSYSDWGVYIQDILEIGKLELTLGGRFDKFDRKINKEGSIDYNDNNFSPRIAAAYEITDGLTLLLGYSETFRAPTPSETSSTGALNPHYYYLVNPNLTAETAKEFEGGFSYSNNSLISESDQLSIKATYFDGKIEDMISLEKLPDLGTPPESRFYAQYQNIDEARRKGYEIMANYFIEDFLFDTSFEHLDLYNEETGENVNQAFADKLQFAVTYFLQDWGIQVGAGMEHWFKPDQNPKTITSRGEVYTYVDQDFTQFNIRGVWDITVKDLGLLNSAKVKFGVNNLTDQQYINARSTNTTSRVGSGTNIYLDLELGF